MGRNRPLPSFSEWRAILDSLGNPIVISFDGAEQPLKHVDPVIRLQNVWLAAQAPALESAVKEFIRVVEMLSSPNHRYTHLVEFAITTLRLCQPPEGIIAHRIATRNQIELELEGESVA